MELYKSSIDDYVQMPFNRLLLHQHDHGCYSNLVEFVVRDFSMIYCHLFRHVDELIDRIDCLLQRNQHLDHLLMHYTMLIDDHHWLEMLHYHHHRIYYYQDVFVYQQLIEFVVQDREHEDRKCSVLKKDSITMEKEETTYLFQQ